MRTLFAVSECVQPSVIFIDEIDSILSARKAEGEYYSEQWISNVCILQPLKNPELICLEPDQNGKVLFLNVHELTQLIRVYRPILLDNWMYSFSRSVAVQVSMKRADD